LATPQTTEGPPAPAPSRSAAAAKRSATARRRAIVGAVVALLVAGGAAILFTGGGDEILEALPGVEPSRPTPEFAFEVKKVVPETTTSTLPRDVAKDVEAIADDVRSTLDALYVGGFVDPDAWGDFGAIEGLFDGAARSQAEGDLDTLTLGAGAGDAYDFVQPEGGVLVIDVLTDAKDAPVLALAAVKFVATAEGTDGSFTQVRSAGTFFLRRDGRDWTITSWRVDRSDRPTEAPTSASPSPAAADDGSAP